MSDEKSQQQTSTESTVAGAAKTGKAISNIAKGAAAGGAHGAAIEAGKSSAKWLIPLIAAVLLPLILVAMLPSIIFGSLLGDGTDTPNGISSDEVLVQNMTAINESISFILSEGLTDVLERIDSDFASSGCDGKEINNPFGADVVFNANAFVSQYCAHKDTDVASISKEDMEALLTASKDKLYSFAFTDEEREIPLEQGDEGSGETVHATIRIYTISYNGEAYFADQVFHLSDDQKLLASQYAQNLTVLLGDGIYQGLSETEFSAMDLSYDGVVFADGETQVVYYNQLDERWKYSPYDDIHTTSAWKILERFTQIPIEHVLIERIKENKSLVDIRLTTGTCREYYQNNVDSFILVSSDSDYWGLISAMPEVRFFVMVESEKCSPTIKNALINAGISYCYIDDFCTGNSNDIKVAAVLREVRQKLDQAFHLNVRDILDEACRATRADMTTAEKNQFYDKYIKTMHVDISPNGEAMIVLGK